MKIYNNIKQQLFFRMQRSWGMPPGIHKLLWANDTKEKVAEL